MYGKSFADGETVVNADVHQDNVKAFEVAGWVEGEHPGAPEASDHDPKVEKAAAKDAKADEKAAPKDDKAKK
jgi:hypothetical protein